MPKKGFHVKVEENGRVEETIMKYLVVANMEGEKTPIEFLGFCNLISEAEKMANNHYGKYGSAVQDIVIYGADECTVKERER